MSITCHHGQLARVCLACDLEREVASLRALMWEMAELMQEEMHTKDSPWGRCLAKYKEMTK